MPRKPEPEYYQPKPWPSLSLCRILVVSLQPQSDHRRVQRELNLCVQPDHQLDEELRLTSSVYCYTRQQRTHARKQASNHTHTHTHLFLAQPGAISPNFCVPLRLLRTPYKGRQYHTRRNTELFDWIDPEARSARRKPQSLSYWTLYPLPNLQFAPASLWQNARITRLVAPHHGPIGMFCSGFAAFFSCSSCLDIAMS